MTKLRGNVVSLGLSGPHLHPTKEMVRNLFGYTPLTIKRELNLEGHWLAWERATIEGPGGFLLAVAIVGPCRERAQLELHDSHRAILRLPKLPERQSGDLDGTFGFTVVGPRGVVKVRNGAIIGAPHIHIPDTSPWAQHTTLAVHVMSSSADLWYDDMPVKVGKHTATEVHLDREQALLALGAGPYLVSAHTTKEESHEH